MKALILLALFSFNALGAGFYGVSVPAGGSSTHYLRGDNTWATLDTLACVENTNLYFTNARAIAATLTGYTSGAGSISSSDSILSAIQKLNGNVALKANIASPTFTGTVTAPTISNTGGVVIEGTNTNDDAAEGKVGQELCQSRVESSRGNVATATAVNVTASALSLTAGDWDIAGTVVFYSNSNAFTNLTAAVSKTSATLPAADTTGVPTAGEMKLIWDMPSTSPGAAKKMFIQIPRMRAKVSSTTSFYLVAQADYTGGTSMEYYGYFCARRPR